MDEDAIQAAIDAALAKKQDMSDHDLMITLNVKMGFVLAALKDGDNRMKDLKTRVGKLESFQNTVLAFAGAVSLAVSTVGSWVLSHFKVT